jgi:hypothetical protein
MSAKNRAEPTLSAAGTMVRFRTMAIARLRWRRARLIIPAYQKPRPAVIVTWRLKFPVRCVQIPCSLAKIPCSAEQGISLQAIGFARVQALKFVAER